MNRRLAQFNGLPTPRSLKCHEFAFAPNRSIPNRTPKMKHLVRSLVMSLLALAAPALHAGHLKVTITPTQAVSAGAQWRVDGGVWRA